MREAAQAVHIHPTALVDPRARLAPGVRVGPYAVIEADVEVGEDTVIGPHVVLHSGTRIGRRNRIYTGAVIGCEPQDRAFRGERSFAILGDDNVVREYVQIARATGPEAATVIGDRNYIMSTAHIAHNCRLGSDVVVVTGSGLAGHVQVGDGAQIGGITGVHQFVRIGRLAMVGGKSALLQDLPPFLLASGVPARVRGLNRVGLLRAGVPREEIERVWSAYRILYGRGLTPAHAVEEIVRELGEEGIVAELVTFVRESLHSPRGLIRRGTSRV
ncbi:MAG: acyl-ACP--UDP-N-acetylglucosamine O-acyltransferase [Armatimonadetes bacterium]|nr:acyl-ACP--UDP-N-acetylglucosamine O-acyltransferase [Armatimonadota bacterium]MDW8154522.1 acyl-ACP--UDP-N-acetylglucosamine O-acyltransferase [Armatimonadota bacterium]